MIDVTVVGSGPNGLVAAVVAARAGLSVRVLEAESSIGGGVRSAGLTLPGFRHDVCSAVHPAALASPVFRKLGLLDRIEWIVPECRTPTRSTAAAPESRGATSTAPPGDSAPTGACGDDSSPRCSPGSAAWCRSPGRSCSACRATRSLRCGSASGRWSRARGAWNLRFLGDVAPALFTGVVAHAAGGMPSLASAGAGLLLAMHAHGVGWGFPKGGSQVIADDLANELRRLGGEIVTDAPVRTLDDVRGSRAVLLDTSPELLLTADLPWG